MTKTRISALLLLAGIAVCAPMGRGEVSVRIKDVARVEGIRSNQLIGYGLVVGLDGTGDKTDATKQTMVSFLKRMGNTVEIGDVKSDNVAAVVVTADLPPFAREGSRIDVTVSCIGDANDLRGGTLLLTPLMGADREVYATCQGQVSTGGFNFGSGGNKVQKNHPTVGRIPNGGIIERETDSPMTDKNRLRLLLFNPDFTTAFNMAEAVNNHFGGNVISQAMDPGTVEVDLDFLITERIGLVEAISRLENLRVISDVAAKVVINERSGTVVASEGVRISTVAISHGGISVEVTARPQVSQPQPLSEGQTMVTQDTEITVVEDSGQIGILNEGATIGDLVNSLNAFGVTSSTDIIAIFQALKEAGALRADLVIM